MRNRHFPRLCRSCRAPMARQEDVCWRCGTTWTVEDRPQLRLMPADADADRWIGEGGSFASEVPPPLPATAATR